MYIAFYPTFNGVIADRTGIHEDRKRSGDGVGRFPVFDGAPVPIAVWDAYDGFIDGNFQEPRESSALVALPP
jgi:hypothetical protein